MEVLHGESALTIRRFDGLSNRAGAPPSPTTRRPVPENPLVADPHGHPLGVEPLEQRNRILPRDPQEILDLLGSDRLVLSEEGHDPPDRVLEGLSVEIESLPDPHEPPIIDQELRDWLGR